MNVKIQGGGGGAYANTGSCAGVVGYLGHEDYDQLLKGLFGEFFSDGREHVSGKEVTYKIDHNKAKLCKNDAKFFVMTVSPSSEELAHLGKTKEEQVIALKKYIRQEVMKNYAEGFGKGLEAKDIMYYAKVHYERHGRNGNDMHVHIIVSRKDISNKIKLSPKTNHTGKKKTGTVSSGFDRNAFYESCERSFDSSTGFKREPTNTFRYLNAVKNGSVKELEDAVNWAEKINLSDIQSESGLNHLPKSDTEMEL